MYYLSFQLFFDVVCFCNLCPLSKQNNLIQRIRIFFSVYSLTNSNSTQQQNDNSTDQDLSNMPKYLAQAPWYLPQGDVIVYFVHYQLER